METETKILLATLILNFFNLLLTAAVFWMLVILSVQRV